MMPEVEGLGIVPLQVSQAAALSLSMRSCLHRQPHCQPAQPFKLVHTSQTGQSAASVALEVLTGPSPEWRCQTSLDPAPQDYAVRLFQLKSELRLALRRLFGKLLP